MWHCIKKDGGIILLVRMPLEEFDDEFLELLYILWN